MILEKKMPKSEKKIVSVASKRTTWNTRRKYNYKYITTVF